MSTSSKKDELLKPFGGEFLFLRGRVGLYAILKALEIGPGDEVATQAFTCVAVPEGIQASGAKPLFIDIEVGGLNMDPQSLAERITPTTKAIVVQHTFGIPAQMVEILRVAKAKKLPLIEDCCHTHDSKYQGQRVGTFGVASFFSYEWGKPIILGIGGSVRINEPGLLTKFADFYTKFARPGRFLQIQIHIQKLIFNAVLTPRTYWMVKKLFHMFARLSLVKGNYNPIGQSESAKDFHQRMLSNLETKYRRDYQRLKHVFAQHSEMVAAMYKKAIQGKRFRMPIVPTGAEPIFARFPILVGNKAGFLNAARSMGIELADWYATPVHPLTATEWSFVNYIPGSCPEAEQRSREVVSLPTCTRVSPKYLKRYSQFLTIYDYYG